MLLYVYSALTIGSIIVGNRKKQGTNLTEVDQLSNSWSGKFDIVKKYVDHCRVFEIYLAE
jgi:hypothetical protein